ncbi:GPI-anchored hemophore cfmA [Capsicum galapagoense]
MKKLYRKGTVHPSPPLVSDHLSFLPAAIFTLAVALSQQDKEVLAYLISCSSGDFSGGFSGKISGNRRIIHKSTPINIPPAASTSVNATVDGGGGGGEQLSGSFSGEFYGNRRNTHNKSATPSSESANSGGGYSKGITTANGGVHGGIGGGGAENELSGDFSGNRRTTQVKSATPSSESANSGVGYSKGMTTAHGGGVGGGADHVTSFNCYCFSCYMSYWVKWDSSPNRQLIHEILDAYEDGLHSKKSKKERRKQNGSSKQNGSGSGSSSSSVGSCNELKKSSSELTLNKNGSGSGSGTGSGSGQNDPVEETFVDGDEEESGEKGSVRKFVSFLGEKIWGIWN